MVLVTEIIMMPLETNNYYWIIVCTLIIFYFLTSQGAPSNMTELLEKEISRLYNTISPLFYSINNL